MQSRIIRGKLFSNHDLFKLFLPLVIEQFLEYLVGLADSIMVASVGEAAVSGVSLVDFVMALLISLFAAIATGGSVVCGQYLGKNKEKEAKEGANQLVWFSGIVALVIMILIYLLKNTILHGLFGTITEEVYSHANIYMVIVALSIPFLAVYNAGAAIFRTMGNSKLPMKIMFFMNILNVAGNAILVFGLKMGTAGIAIPTLVSRIGAALIILILALNKKNTLSLKKSLKYRFNKDMIKRILGIGVPYGLENGMFHFGRLLILSLVSRFGTAAIAANSVGGTIVMFEVLPGMSIGFGLTVVISRCIGASDYEQAKYYTNKIMKIIYVAQVVSSAIVILLLPIILNVYNLSPEATFWTKIIVWSHAIMMMLIWPLGYTLPVTFRSAGDAKFPMMVSMISMIFCRIALAYVFSLLLGWGMFGTWMAMFFDWIVKSIIFTIRYIKGTWTKYHVIA